MYLYIRPLAAHKHSKQTHIFPVTNLMFTSPALPPTNAVPQSRSIVVYYDIVVLCDKRSILRCYIVVYYVMLLFSKVQKC